MATKCVVYATICVNANIYDKKVLLSCLLQLLLHLALRNYAVWEVGLHTDKSLNTREMRALTYRILKITFVYDFRRFWCQRNWHITRSQEAKLDEMVIALLAHIMFYARLIWKISHKNIHMYTHKIYLYVCK